MKIEAIIVDEIPKNCGDCCLMEYVNDRPRCFGVSPDISELEGSPYGMTYRRSDCPLVED